MIGRQERGQRSLFIPGSIEDYIPDDHILKQVDGVLDLSWLRDEVADTYCRDNGRPSIDPKAALRLMLAGLFHGITHDRKLMREAQVNLAIRWFAGYTLDDNLPDHSSLTRIRQRWGAERFRRVFERSVGACIEGGLVTCETVHVDATLIRADVSWESLTTEHAEKVWRENVCAAAKGEDADDEPARRRGRPRTRSRHPKKRSTTDPDATMTTTSRDHHLEPSYKQHTAVDDASGVIVDVELTTGEMNEGKELLATVERVETTTEHRIAAVTADKAYAHAANYAALEKRCTVAVIPPVRQPKQKKRMPLSRFKYDAVHNRVKCPAGKLLRPVRRTKRGWDFRSSRDDCRRCRFREGCITASLGMRSADIVDGYDALLRARRRHAGSDEQYKLLYRRHRWRVEGVHGEAKTQHGLGRATRRGLTNVAIQVYLTAAVMNLKRLAKAFWAPFLRFLLLWRSSYNCLGRIVHLLRHLCPGIPRFTMTQRCMT